MNEKDVNSKEYFTASEFAERVNIPLTQLQYYDRIGVFSPSVIITRGGKEYRYYAPIQITNFHQVRVLTDFGVASKTVKQLTKDRTPIDLLKLLSQNKRIIGNELNYLNEKDTAMGIYYSQIVEGLSAYEDEIILCEMLEIPITLGDETQFSEDEGFMREFLAFCDKPRKPMLSLLYHTGGYFVDMDAFLTHPSQPTRFYSLDPNGGAKKEKSLYLVGYTRGYYGQTNDLPERLVEYAKANGTIFEGAGI